MGYLGRRIGLSQDNGDSNPGGAGGAVGGGLLDLFAHGYFERQGDLYNNPGLPAFGGPEGITATGGVISDYVDGPLVYRAHVFTSSGALNVTNTTSNFGATVEYLVVAGGGSGGSCWPSWGGGGGGAGGFRTNVSGHPLAAAAFPVSVNPYPVVVGAGGASTGTAIGKNPGNPSTFSTITSTGGGGGGGGNGFPSPGTEPGSAGGSGGGGAGGGSSENGGATTAVTTPSPWPGPSVQGFIGGGGADGNTAYTAGGGGGGAGAGGQSAHDLNPGPKTGGYGGVGSPIAIETATAKFYAGGGGGSSNENSTVGAAGGNGGGGKGGDKGGTLGTPTGAFAGTYATGGGGGAGIAPNISENGGSGIVVVRYQIGRLTASAKATGGAISFAGGKTVHVFTNSGTFTVTNGPITCDYLVVGGGASGGLGCGSGGGAGGYRTSLPEGPGGPSPSAESAQAIANGPYAVTVGGGGATAGNGSLRQVVGSPGTISNIAFPSAIRSEGGGGGGHVGGPGGPGVPGGSGGGGNYGGGSSGTGNKVANTSTAAPNQGYHGGSTFVPSAGFGAGGGGGAGGAGVSGTSSDGGDGGTGKQNTVTGVTLSLAGGGGGNIYYPQSTVGDATHGGGQGAPHAGVAPESGPTSIHGHSSTGGGGGGGLRANGPGPSTGIPPGLPASTISFAGQGGSGIVIIAYDTV